MRSPQASHYFDILNHFEAVVKKKRAETKKTRTTSDVERLISFSQPSLEDSTGSMPDFDMSLILDGMQDGLIGQDDVFLDWDQVAWQF